VNYNLTSFFIPKENFIPIFVPIAGFTMDLSGELTFNPNSFCGLWLQNSYVLI
jgi:hypothetical protein